ncbi:BREX-1 system adenine-specific DNA-methyltransferase PglX [Natrinema halophilum]|uniref:site-specific DNA-methyltransferase (adenine-specific) n=1 Tax=Natrinema halophilum TaxID=1699371 RepID=A0A7D5GSU5_9EURY|nr:BREX-1 system adenine-specific DNA-methyltransferase PglX [Natrinema halophilum]QLG49569.1 BREX-1 system adenine-specific DNA-methyltransferase PglX [Natrinema halophilum]
MSTTHGQPGLSSEQRSTIRSTILRTRHALEDELRRQFEKYGIYEKERLSIDTLTHLSDEEIHTRRTLDAAIERELESTEGDVERSITNYVREATKTYLNRFVALKAIEVRGLVEETITERPEYGNRSYMHHTVAEIAGELTNAPDDGFGAALDLAYQEIGAEIRMIFEESEHTVIELDAQVREEVLDELDAIDDEAWESDEALGWVYQYFGEEEREEIDERIDDENYKIAGTDIATKTQLFTPRYIVEWMVDNSLGRTWLEMQGGHTNIDDEENCFYLAPLEESLIDRETKPVEEITVLDPACGSGHLLFYAFDVLYQMYLEEGEVPEKYIPREILRNNLYGIDIDSGAAQIAALALYLKAKERSPDVTIPRLNIVSADAVLINGDRKQEVLNRARSELEEEILKQIWRSFDNIREWGSLVQIDDPIDQIVDEHRDTFESKGQTQFTPEGEITAQSTFVSGGKEETWEELKVRLVENVREVADAALEQDDLVEEMFATEVGKTVQLLDVLHEQYDVIVSNPPYLQSKKMGENLKEFIRSNYAAKVDAYGAFIERCLNFAKEDGYVSMITPETFMYQYYFRGFRSALISDANLTDHLHISNRDQAYMNIASIMRPIADESPLPSRYLRIVEADKKPAAANRITRSCRQGEENDQIFTIDQETFAEIDRTPFLYRFGKEVLDLFVEHSNFGDRCEVKQGLSTADDEQFVRKWWEIPTSSIGERYVRYQMSGTNSVYYDYAADYLDWENSGEVVREAGANFRNEDHYFERGASFRGFGNYLVGRLHTEDMIFGHTSHFVSSEEYTAEIILAHLNSTIHRFIANGLNPGLHFEVGDGKRLPIKNKLQYRDAIEALVNVGIDQRRRLSKVTETSADYSPEFFVDVCESGVLDLCRFEDACKAKILTAHGLVDSILFDEYDISRDTQEQMYSDLPKNVAHYPLTQSDYSSSCDEFNDRLTVEQLDPADRKKAVATIKESDEMDLRELALETELSPLTIAALRENHELYTEAEKERAAGRVLSFIVGKIFGRWEPDPSQKATSNEILVFGADSDSPARLVENVIDETFPAPATINEQLTDSLGRDPISWLRDRFFRYHHVDEYKRRGQRNPLYWQLESPEGAFSCLVYYHGIDTNTLPKLRGRYLDSRIEKLENELETLNSQITGDDPEKELLQRKETVRNDLADVREFRDTIDEMIDDGLTVDIEKGIWENIKEWDQYEVLETGLPKLKSSYSR